MDSYKVDNKYCSMVRHNLRYMHLQEVLDTDSSRPCQWYGLWMRIKGPHNYMVMCEVANQGPWLMCELALRATLHTYQEP